MFQTVQNKNSKNALLISLKETMEETEFRYPISMVEQTLI